MGRARVDEQLGLGAGTGALDELLDDLRLVERVVLADMDLEVDPGGPRVPECVDGDIPG
jgi:hypothetical protein